MRVVIINSLYPPLTVGGAEKSVFLLAEALACAGDQVSVVTLHAGSEEVIESQNGIRVYRLPIDNRYWPFGGKRKHGWAARLLWHLGDVWNRKAARRVARILDQERPEVVHTNVISGFSVAVWREAKTRNIRLVHTLRDYYLLCPRSALFREGSICARRCVGCKAMTANRRSASQLVDTVVAVSEYVLNCHTQRGYFRGSPSSVIYNIGGMHSPAGPRDDREDTLIFGYIGRLEDEKGIQVVLEAIQYLSGSNWRLKIAGAGLDRYVNGLKQKFSDPRIEWLGFVGAEQFYAAIDVTIVSSVWPEPLSRTVIETFAAGKSAICAQSGGIPEIANMGKVVATYCATDPRALAAIMDRAMLDTELWRGGGFRDADALSLFSDASIRARYHAIYKSIAKGDALAASGSESSEVRSKAAMLAIAPEHVAIDSERVANV